MRFHRNAFAIADDFAASRANRLTGVAVCAASSFLCAFYLGVCVGASGRLTFSIYGEGISAGLRRHSCVSHGIHRGCEHDSNDATVFGGSCACRSGQPRSDILASNAFAVDFDFSYTGIADNQLGVFVKTNGVGIVSYVAGA